MPEAVGRVTLDSHASFPFPFPFGPVREGVTPVTPALRPLRTACALALGAVLLAAPSADAVESPQPSLAGHPAGEGRARPGRALPTFVLPSAPEALPEADATPGALPEANPPGALPEADVPPEADAPAPEAKPSPARPAHPPAAARQSAAQAVARPSQQAVPLLTLGAGLALTGLGIGFFGARLRRR